MPALPPHITPETGPPSNVLNQTAPARSAAWGCTRWLPLLAIGLLGCTRDCSISAGGPGRGETRQGSPPIVLAGVANGSPEPDDLRPLAPAETTPAIEQRAKELLETHPDAPLKAEMPFEIEGHAYIGRIEEHYHEPGGPKRPWGRHRGVTVYHAR